MEYEKPLKKGFTVYSKSGCPNCSKVKQLIKEKNYNFLIIDCDEYLIEDKEDFLSYMKTISSHDITSFPIIFYNEKFIGGYKETLDYVNKVLEIDFEEDF